MPSCTRAPRLPDTANGVLGTVLSTHCHVPQCRRLMQIPEECDPESPFSYQFIDPTRHFTTYGPQTSRPISDLCTKLLQVRGVSPGRSAA